MNHSQLSTPPSSPTFSLLREKRRLAVINPENGARSTISLREWQQMLWAIRVHPEPQWRQPRTPTPRLTASCRAHASRIGWKSCVSLRSKSQRSFPEHGLLSPARRRATPAAQSRGSLRENRHHRAKRSIPAACANIRAVVARDKAALTLRKAAWWLRKALPLFRKDALEVTQSRSVVTQSRSWLRRAVPTLRRAGSWLRKAAPPLRKPRRWLRKAAPPIRKAGPRLPSRLVKSRSSFDVTPRASFSGSQSQRSALGTRRRLETPFPATSPTPGHRRHVER